MARRTSRPRKPVNPLQALHDREAAAEARQPLVNAFAAQHGDYERNLRFVVNRGGTTLDRWTRAGELTDRQQAAIRHVQQLWRRIDSSSRLVSNWDRTVFGAVGEGHAREIEARDDLTRLRRQFGPGGWWDIFENVCRHDMASGQAGAHLRRDPKRTSGAVLATVQIIADMIAEGERLSY